MEITKVTCNHCKADLSECEAVQHHRLNLTSSGIPMRGGYVFDVYIHPILDESHHFCGLGCLKKWINALLPDITAKDTFCPSGKYKESLTLKSGVDLTCNHP